MLAIEKNCNVVYSHSVASGNMAFVSGEGLKNGGLPHCGDGNRALLGAGTSGR